MANGNLVSDEWIRRLYAMYRWQRGFTVRGASEFRNTEDTCTISIASRPSSESPPSADPPKIIGSRQYQHFQMLTDTQAGWDYSMFSGMLPPL